jgi:hypothetical protein
MRIKAAAADALRNTLFRQMNSSAYFLRLSHCNMSPGVSRSVPVKTSIFINNIVSAV